MSGIGEQLLLGIFIIITLACGHGFSGKYAEGMGVYQRSNRIRILRGG